MSQTCQLLNPNACTNINLHSNQIGSNFYLILRRVKIYPNLKILLIIYFFHNFSIDKVGICLGPRVKLALKTEIFG